MLKDFVKWAEENKWDIILNPEKVDLPEEIKNRYNIPKQWYDFISMFKKCENQSATKCFLTPYDYLPHEEDYKGFRWNEFEILSLEWNDNDSSIISYWDCHLPIVLSVDGEYSYYAINTVNGNIVEGYEPEFEDSSVVADDFNTFIRKIISNDILI